jgi:acetyl esterase/lipase
VVLPPRLLLAVALILLFLASWIVLPAPNRPLLALAVGAPELSAWLLAGALVVLALSFAGPASPADTRHYIRLMAATAAIVAAMPLVRIPSTVRRFDAAMHAAIGDEWMQRVPEARRGGMRQSPVSVLDLFRGVTIGEARITRGVPWAWPQGVPLTLDVYQPPARGRYPAIVQIYGGAWQRGAPGDDARFATYFAARGFVVFAIDYRHAPAWQWPAQIDDVHAALRWIAEHGGGYDADVARVALVGRSAGAQLAMMAAYDGPGPELAGVISYYGPVDLADGYRHPPSPDPIDVRGIEEAFLGGSPDQRPDRYRDASPIFRVSSAAPPTLLIYGRRDHVVLSRYGAMLDARLRSARATSIFLEIPWAEHVFDAIASGPSGQLSLYYAERFLTWALVVSPARTASAP